MQIKLKIALAAASFALATIPAFAVEMPTDGSKNFSSPNDAPSYFTNETVPESARVANPASFTSEDVAAVPEDGPAVSGATETDRHDRHASAHSSTKHSVGRSRGHGATTRYAKATSSKSSRTVAFHTTAKNANAGSRSASMAKAAEKSAMPTGASKSNATKHAKTSAGQHATAAPPAEPSRTSVS
jgi:hypothetical protein